MGWWLLAATGMRRGEGLALRWRDVDLDAGRLAVRRSVGVIKAKGAGERLVEGPTKTGRGAAVRARAPTPSAEDDRLALAFGSAPARRRRGSVRRVSTRLCGSPSR
jgi:hypothetical protein